MCSSDLIDGTREEIVLDPDTEALALAERASTDRQPAPVSPDRRPGPAVTADGVRIRLDANIEFADDLAAVRYAGAEGVGKSTAKAVVISSIWILVLDATIALLLAPYLQ